MFADRDSVLCQNKNYRISTYVAHYNKSYLPRSGMSWTMNKAMKIPRPAIVAAPRSSIHSKFRNEEIPRISMTLRMFLAILAIDKAILVPFSCFCISMMEPTPMDEM